ncbi:hypothetical protein Ahia01_000464700 [Argonauta hians]
METTDVLKKKIRSVLLSSKHGVVKSEFLNEYQLLTGEDIDFTKVGFRTLEGFMRSIPDTVSCKGNSYFAVSCDTTNHLEKLIQNQKSVNKKSKLKAKVNLLPHNKPSHQYIQNDKHRIRKKNKDHFSPNNNIDTGIPRCVSMKDVRTQAREPSPPTAWTRNKHTSVPVADYHSQPVKDLKIKLLSILYEAPDGLSAQDLQQQYRLETGRCIPLREYGYKSIEELMLHFSMDNIVCVKERQYFVAVTQNTKLYHTNKHHVSTPSLYNKRSGQNITVEKHFNVFNDSQFQKSNFSEYDVSGISRSIHNINSPLSSQCDCPCHLPKSSYTWKCYDFCLYCSNNNIFQDGARMQNTDIKPRKVTLVDNHKYGSEIKSQNGKDPLQELRISFLNTRLGDSTHGNDVKRQITPKKQTEYF